VIRKTVLTPVFRLDGPDSGEFVEMVVEPQCSWRPHPWFRHLQGLGLDRAIRLARRALTVLPPPESPVDLYWTNPSSPLSQTEGIALALALGAWAAMHERCPYGEIFVVGRLALPRPGTRGGATIEDTGYLASSLAAISALGTRTQASCLILPLKARAESDQQVLLAHIEQLGIDLHPVETLAAAVAACVSMESSRREWL
jgi:hypothetical protein